MTNPEPETQQQDKTIKQDHSDEYVDYEEVGDQENRQQENQEQKSEFLPVVSSKL
jgi:hypothetical protein